MYEYLGKISQRDEYELIYPILIMLGFHIDGDEFNVFADEKSYGKTVKHFLKDIIKQCIYFSIRVRYQKRKRKEKICLCSPSLLNNRYDQALELILRNKEIAGVVTSSVKRQMFVHREFYTRGLYLKQVASFKTIQLVHECFVHLKRVKSNGITCDDVEGTKFLYDKLRLEVRKDIDRLKKKLLEYNVWEYITISTQSLFELLIITACKECQITTKEIVHCSYACISPNYEIMMQKNIFTEYLYLWNESEVKYFRKYKNYCCYMYPAVCMKVIGSPEVCYEDARKALEKFPTEKRVTLFVPSYVMFLDRHYVKYESGQEVICAEKRAVIYEKIYRAVRRSGMQLYLRYHPGEPKEIIAYEEDIRKKLGLICISPYDETIEQCVCKSHSVFGSTTSALVVACIYGTKCYDFRISDEVVDYCDMGVMDICLENIDSLDFKPYEKSIRRDYCFNENLLLFERNDLDETGEVK